MQINDTPRPNWNNYFMGLAFVASLRSSDPNTKHGCVIVDKNKKLLGIGYNGPVAGVDDRKIPKTRPEKYPHYIHSELNSILNCRVLPKDIGGGTAYVTGQCCNQCFISLIQAGVNVFFMANRHGSALLNEETQKIFNQIKDYSGVTVNYMDVDLDWMKVLFKKE